ncbi:MAG: Hsp20/alpha crystallin family protein [Saprospiraceae bacterium]|nr:Hsp20/alpha crystallin family protein [Saprospiraceae bacterium]
MSPVTNQIGTMVEDLLNRGLNDIFGGQVFQSSVPAVNVSENDQSFLVDVAAPGLKKEDFKLSLEKGFLNISASKEEKKEETNEQFSRKEFNYSSFSRSFKLPEHADASKITASYKDGVLHITIDKKTVVKEEKTIEIQ